MSFMPLTLTKNPVKFLRLQRRKQLGAALEKRDTSANGAPRCSALALPRLAAIDRLKKID